MRTDDEVTRSDLGKVYLWEQIQQQAKRLKLEISQEYPHFQVYPTEEFMGSRTPSAGGRLTTGIATLEGLSAFLHGIEAIVRREELIQSMIRQPEPVVVNYDDLSDEMKQKLLSEQPNNVRRLSPDQAYRVLQHIWEILYWDSDELVFDPDKEWDSAADFMEMVAEQFTLVGMEPAAGPE